MKQGGPEMNNTTIHEELLREVNQIARSEHRTPDDVVNEAVQRLVRQRRREKLYAYGEQRAAELGLREEDVPRLIEETRNTERPE